MGMPKEASTGSRFRLGEPWDTELGAFCAAVIDADRTKVVRRAVSAYIRQFISENDGDKIACKRGHPLSGINLYIVVRRGARKCRTCQREDVRRYKIRKGIRL